jgi:hypothetical protein
MKNLEVCKMFRRGFVVVSMLVVSFAAALLGAADVRAEQPGATQKQRWPVEKILPKAWSQSLLAPRLRRETSRCASAAEGQGADFFPACFGL